MRRSDREVKEFEDIVAIMVPFNKSVMPHTKVFKLVVEKVTGKVRMKKNDKQ